MGILNMGIVAGEFYIMRWLEYLHGREFDHRGGKLKKFPIIILDN